MTSQDPERTLAAIDDVIAWYGSADAMVWTAEPPAAPVPTPVPTPVPAHVAGNSAAPSSDRPVGEMLIRGVSAWARSPAVQQMITFAQCLDGRTLMDAYERGGSERVADPCHCICGVRHADRPDICTGEAAGSRPCHSARMGIVNVVMCRPCLDAE
ncbi:hypothetical protein [Microbispora sp. NPDC049125]|uniref:hypothetical protein n=1 Tax=Microbispora sp. NPDC049125 TaxID=3154929 RepID=UPI00346728C6